MMESFQNVMTFSWTYHNKLISSAGFECTNHKVRWVYIVVYKNTITAPLGHKEVDLDSGNIRSQISSRNE
jgi:hypothetical protein